MNLDAGSLFAGFFVSSIGLGLLMYGRKMNRFPQLGVGLALLVYPYFVSSALFILAIAAALLVALWLALRLDW